VDEWVMNHAIGAAAEDDYDDGVVELKENAEAC